MLKNCLKLDTDIEAGDKVVELSLSSYSTFIYMEELLISIPITNNFLDTKTLTEQISERIRTLADDIIFASEEVMINEGLLEFVVICEPSLIKETGSVDILKQLLNEWLNAETSERKEHGRDDDDPVSIQIPAVFAKELIGQEDVLKCCLEREFSGVVVQVTEYNRESYIAIWGESRDCIENLKMNLVDMFQSNDVSFLASLLTSAIDAQTAQDASLQPCTNITSYDAESQQIFDVPSSFSAELLSCKDRFIEAIQERFPIRIEFEQNCQQFKAFANSRNELNALNELLTPMLIQEDLQELHRFLVPLHNDRIDVGAIHEILFEDNGKLIKWLSRQHNVRTNKEFLVAQKKVILVVNGREAVAVKVFVAQIRDIIANKAAFKKEWDKHKQKKLHIFVDLSNILIGAQHTEAGIEDKSIRIRARSIIELVTDARDSTPRRLVVGSISEHEAETDRTTSAMEFIWKDFASEGFTVQKLMRVSKGAGKRGEQTVDEVIHAQMAIDILKEFAEPHTIVLLTGKN